MLETIKKYISNLDNRSFSEYYISYISDLDEYLLDLEVGSPINNKLSLLDIDNLLSLSIDHLSRL